MLLYFKKVSKYISLKKSSQISVKSKSRTLDQRFPTKKAKQIEQRKETSGDLQQSASKHGLHTFLYIYIQHDDRTVMQQATLCKSGSKGGFPLFRETTRRELARGTIFCDHMSMTI